MRPNVQVSANSPSNGLRSTHRRSGIPTISWLWIYAGLQLVLNVNVSGKSIGDRQLAAVMEDALAEAEIDPARLILELTETAAISNIEEAKGFACCHCQHRAGNRQEDRRRVCCGRGDRSSPPQDRC